MKKGNHISIKEIARLSGVSVATVSRVINDNGRFSDETRKKVMDVINKHHYETNFVAKSLRMNKSQTIGLLVPDISNEFFAAIVQEIERLFFEEGYSTIICNTAKSAEKEKEYLKTLEGKMVDGLICISGQEEILTDILRRNVPIVCIDRRPKINKNVAFIESNHLEGGRLATEELIRKGCKNILLLTKRNNLSSVNERLKGYEEALKQYGFPIHEQNVVYIDEHSNNLEGARKVIQKALDADLSFDGIFATNDWLALGAMLMLQEKGYNIPEQVKIVGFDNNQISKYCNPPLTTIDQDEAILAKHAYANLLDMINGSAVKHGQHTRVPVHLVERKTT
ncbi:MAG: LacI family DNA-binding transcriptional regulator [Paenibacillus macerans]|uniref:Helix-turn-helix family protein n=1 Tax=Paenibacillus macerans TaxID=44252 RepID=A0A090YBB5_PAEMA|nr:LacI family DNA-binding transcriptional regulator [Paenibacillus macerans]KFM95794.1 helix-turn-helix family protein [Paenibacillus macerans]MBS5912958.1 LacI family DNA-binding transcriptional regulator [Paenibacillus macerans]MCY7558840.1 LacI family transcriptional regulator [Paenibacillus macerans]MDU7475516.1 LacI family DNA-binding transcriptional regulator [Paenibacillus macerans]MEC0140829.1 LacI family DNA-binding transcriptional regulator [Paenibacillus macerans]